LFKQGTFKTWFVAGILGFQRRFDIDILDFQFLSFVLDILAFLGLETFWVTF